MSKTTDDESRTLADFIEIGRALGHYGRRGPGPAAGTITRVQPRAHAAVRDGGCLRDPQTLAPGELLAEVDAEIAALARAVDNFSSTVIELRRYRAVRPILAALVALDGKPPADVEVGAVEAQRAFWQAVALDPYLRAVADAIASIVDGARATRYAPAARLVFCRRCRALLRPRGRSCPECHAPRRW